MTSINYNASAANAVRVLQSVNRDLSTTQNRIATGFKVNSAADDATVWRVASGLRSDIKSFESTSASMEYAKGAYQAAAAGADTLVNLVTQIRTAITAGVNATAGSAARANAQSQLEDLQAQLKAALADAKLGDTNLLDGTGTAPKIITSFSGSSGVTTSTFTTTDLDATTTGLIGFADTASYGNDQDPTTPVDHTILTTTIVDLVATATTATTNTQINTLIKNISDYGSKLSVAAARIQSSQDLMGKLADIRKSALSSMVDADLEAESAKLQSLQVKQQLATQALTIANASGQNILRLFQ